MPTPVLLSWVVTGELGIPELGHQGEVAGGTAWPPQALGLSLETRDWGKVTSTLTLYISLCTLVKVHLEFPVQVR